MRASTLSVLVTFVLAGLLPAQSPVPVIVPAVTPAIAKAPAAAPNATSDSISAALKMLQEMKIANEEMLGKQAAMLAQLDELEKAAEQIRIYTRRN
jgi:hypothetical protein